MTATAVIVEERPTLWSSMPGWGIAADLIPPELINARQLKVIRKLLAIGIVLLLAACAGGYYLAVRENTSASADLTSVQDETLQLQKASQLYSGVIAIQGSITQVKAQIAKLMVGDVDLVALINGLQANLPATMTINQLAITISTAGVAAAAPGGSGLDTSGLPRIGTLTIGGTGQALTDLSDYVDNLSAVDGLVDVMPVSNSADPATARTTFSLTIGLTDALLSHRFDVGTG